MTTSAASRKAERTVHNVFLVIDPTRLVQPALEKAEWVASRNRANLHMYCCIWEPDLDRADERVHRAIAATQAWLERIAASSRALGLAVSTEVDWHPNWRGRISEVALAHDADLIVKGVSRRSLVRRQLMQTSDWTLLRHASCPTLLVHPNRPSAPKVVLAAVKLKPGSEAHAILNDKVISLGRRLADAFDAELHAVTVYKGDDVYFDRQKFADRCELPRNRIHATDGTPARGIAAVTEEIGADVLIVGCARNEAPQRGIIVGDTAQRVIDEVDTDVIVIPAD